MVDYQLFSTLNNKDDTQSTVPISTISIEYIGNGLAVFLLSLCYKTDTLVATLVVKYMQ